MRSLAISLILLAAVVMPDADAQDVKRLEHMLIQDCGSCHGLTMRGGLGRPLTREALAESDPNALAAIILEGVPGTAMPGWRSILKEEEALWMANYLKKGLLQ